MKKLVFLISLLGYMFLGACACINPSASNTEADEITATPDATHQLQNPANILRDGEEFLHTFYDLMSYPKEQMFECGTGTRYKSLEKVEQQLAGKKVFCAKVKMAEPYYRFTLRETGINPYFLCSASYEIIELYYQDSTLSLSNGDVFEDHSGCFSTQIENGIFVPRVAWNNVWAEYGKEYLLLGYINEEGTDSTPPVAALPYLYEWDISREEEAEEREQYGLLPRDEDKFVIRDQIMEKYVN